MQVKTLLLAACMIAGVSAVAHADAFECKSTETQAECHDRLKCKANEEVADCQQRLRSGSQQNRSNDDRDRGARDRDGDRGDDGRAASDRGRDRGDSDRGESDDSNRAYRDDGGSSERRGRRRSGGGSHSSFEANKKFGLGLELGEPDGLNGKYFVSPNQALDFGIGYVYDHYYYGNGFHVYGDYLWHFSLASTAAFELPLYIGPGLRLWQFDYCVGNVCNYGGSAIGVRMPVGIAFDFNNAPLDIFLQLVPTLDFLSGDYYMRYGDRAHFGVDGSVGIRFWFN